MSVTGSASSCLTPLNCGKKTAEEARTHGSVDKKTKKPPLFYYLGKIPLDIQGDFCYIYKARVLDGGGKPCVEAVDCADGRELSRSKSGDSFGGRVLESDGTGVPYRVYRLDKSNRLSRYVFWDRV